MKRRLMEILACPIDKHYPLDLLVLEEKDEITEGLITCSECGRWYPIIDEIPQMLPDDLREAREDLDWMKRWQDKIPQKMLTNGRPFNLASPQPPTRHERKAETSPASNPAPKPVPQAVKNR